MMFHTLSFELPDGRTIAVEVRRALAAGATGRDGEKVRSHIARLAGLGVQPPAHVPMLYPLMPTLVTQAGDIGVIGLDSTPEVEAVIFTHGGADYVTVGSDHTDRRIEAASSLHGKNSCPKPVAGAAWPLAEVRDHWDALELRAGCGEMVLQEGRLAHLIPVQALLAFVARHDGERAEGRFVFGGTVPTAAAPPRGEATIRIELRDPVRGRALSHTYTAHVFGEYFRAPDQPASNSPR